MDALKKAELAKRQGNSPLEFESTTPTAGLALEPVAETSSPALISPSLLEPVLLEAAPKASKFPDLPTHLETLEPRYVPPPKTEPVAPVAPVVQETPLGDALPTPPTQQQNRPEESPAKASNRPVSAPPPRPASTVTPESKVTTEQAAAKNVFAAKAEPLPGKKNRFFLIGVSIATLCSVAGIAGYSWWQLQPKSGLTMSPAIAARPTAAAAAIAPPNPAPVATASPTPQPGAIPEPASATSSAVPPAPTLTDKVRQQAQELANDLGSPVPKSKPSVSAESRRASTPNPASNTGRLFTPTTAHLQISPALTRGYEAYDRGDLASARKEYQAVLKGDPYNVDALRGMAMISLREGRSDIAEAYFQRILIGDPQDGFAIAGLANLHSASNPGAAESRLRNIVIAQPENAAPQFALGNVYAAQDKWSEAQQAYFKAYSIEPGNPDILYNLAISLEHLRQNKLAAQYYGLAIQAAATRPSGFDPAQATLRLRALQP